MAIRIDMMLEHKRRELIYGWRSFKGRRNDSFMNILELIPVALK